jgi:hypothetical protein
MLDGYAIKVTFIVDRYGLTACRGLHHDLPPTTIRRVYLCHAMGAGDICRDNTRRDPRRYAPGQHSSGGYRDVAARNAGDAGVGLNG